MSVYTVRSDLYLSTFDASFTSDLSKAEELLKIAKACPINVVCGDYLKKSYIVESESSAKLFELIKTHRTEQPIFLTLEEAEILSNSLICLIKSTNEALQKIHDVNISEVLEKRVFLYQKLNSKICDFFETHDDVVENRIC